MPSFGGYAGGNHRSVKRGNRAAIFRAIHALGPIARVDLARETGLNPSTVSHIVDELITGGLARETGYRTSPRSGRRPVFLEIDPTARYAVGVDLARNAITAGLVDLSGRLVDRHVEDAEVPWRGESALAAARRMVERLLAPLPTEKRRAVVGVGIGAPGPVSTSTGRYLAPQDFAAWQDFDLTGQLERQVELPTYIDNNANTSALGELWFGAGQGIDNFVLLNLGTGIGTGLVLGGDLYRGNHDLAGELGHVTVDLDGPLCICGNYGCLETYASVPRVLAAYATGRSSRRTTDSEEPTVESMLTALRDGDPLARQVITNVGRHLAAGLVNVIYTLDPELILIGRQLATAGEDLLGPMRAEVRRRIFPALRDAIRIEPVALPDAPVVGAATLALRGLFEAPLSGRTP